MDNRKRLLSTIGWFNSFILIWEKNSYLSIKKKKTFLTMFIIRLGDTDDDDDDDDKRLKNMKPITQFELFFSNDSDAHQTAFPNSFSINFTEFDLTFDNTFVKISSNPKFKSSNIYVIDEETREPRLYDLPSQEVFFTN